MTSLPFSTGELVGGLHWSGAIAHSRHAVCSWFGALLLPSALPPSACSSRASSSAAQPLFAERWSTFPSTRGKCSRW